MIYNAAEATRIVLPHLLDSAHPETSDGTTTTTSSLQTLDEVVVDQITKALKTTRGKVGGSDGATAILGENPSTLRNKMDKLGIAYGKQTIGS